MSPRIYMLIALILMFAAACSRKVRSGESAENRTAAARPIPISGTRVVSPPNKQSFTLGEEIPAEIELISDTLPAIDSVVFLMDGIRRKALYAEPFLHHYASANLRTGTRALRIMVCYADSRKEYHNRDVILLSDIVPRPVNYQVVNTWPHDRGAYTQGLVYADGFLYEGTGQKNESSLRKTEIHTGEPVRMMNLPGEIFGEGITILNDKIYQLTYKSQVGFVYDKESFRRIQRVYYENKEGWGLTNDSAFLIMSDGSHRIFYMDPEYFTEIRQLEVFDDKDSVSRLNELEYIQGRIFANVYGEERIVIIDPEKGRVTGILNMKGILPEEDRHRRIDVFNGIAWNPEKKLLYVTGKYWPKLFEITLPEGIP